MNRFYRHMALWMLVALLPMSFFSSCERKDLYLAQRGLLNVDVSVYDFRLDVMWEGSDEIALVFTHTS